MPAARAPVGVAEGLAPESAVHCDEVVSLPKSALTDSSARFPRSGQ